MTVRRNDDAGEVVDDEFVHAVGTEGGSGDGGDGAACFYVAEGGVLFVFGRVLRLE